ncbi:hypothetical protein M2323_004721, partial [Rhodoblastus acidophilus]|uniref:pre-peptidase C-terminal domain-containing protein n=1 Tax=Rhodoblastus acidophilus TaxID=1074 RepID=UPI002226CD5E
SLGALSATAVAKTDWVGDAAPDEWFKFTVGAPSSVSLNLSGLVNSATLTLLDANGGQINYASGNASATGGLLANLAAGTYYAKINAGSDTPFTLTASATALPNAAGQTLAAATALAAPTATVASVSDWVGAAAPNDYYTFTLASAATVNLQLASTLDTLTLYDASGAEIASASPGSGYPLLTNALAAGTYYVKVNGSSNGAYTLSSWTGAATVGTSSASDTAGNTLAAANATTFGALTSTAKTVAGWVSATDTDDYYKFTVTGPATVALSLSGVSATAYLNLYNAAGDSIRSDYAYSTTPGSLVANLATGTYYVDVNNYYGSTGYSLSASATALPNAAGTTLAIATSLGALSSTAVTKSDWVGAA